MTGPISLNRLALTACMWMPATCRPPRLADCWGRIGSWEPSAAARRYCREFWLSRWIISPLALSIRPGPSKPRSLRLAWKVCGGCAHRLALVRCWWQSAALRWPRRRPHWLPEPRSWLSLEHSSASRIRQLSFADGWPSWADRCQNEWSLADVLCYSRVSLQIPDAGCFLEVFIRSLRVCAFFAAYIVPSSPFTSRDCVAQLPCP